MWMASCRQDGKGVNETSGQIDKSYEALEQRIKELEETVKLYKEEIEALRGEDE